MMELHENFSSPLSVQHTYEDDVRDELCLQLAENLGDVGACEFTREIVAGDTRWLITMKRL